MALRICTRHGGSLPDVQHQGLLRVWRRHMQRRRDGVPSVSVAVIATDQDRANLEGALAAAGARIVTASASDALSMASEWLSGIASEHDVIDEAFGFIAHELGERESELRSSWAARGENERKIWLDGWSQGAGAPLRAARECLRAAIDVGDNAQRDPLTELLALFRWLPQHEQLVLSLEVSGPAALRTLLQLSAAEPSVPWLAVIPGATWPSTREQLEDRSRTFLDAGLLPLTEAALLAPPLDPLARSSGSAATDADAAGPVPSSAAGAELEQLAAEAVVRARAASAR